MKYPQLCCLRNTPLDFCSARVRGFWGEARIALLCVQDFEVQDEGLGSRCGRLREKKEKSSNLAFMSRFPFCPLVSFLGYSFPCVLSAYSELK